MLAREAAVYDPHQLLGALAERGWSRHSSEAMDHGSIVRELGQLGDWLGRRVPGRAGSLEEVVKPRTVDDAHPRSLSARYGLGTLPFHTELSHRTRPCRYLLLGCINPGSPAAATVLLDWRTLGFSREELDLLEHAPVLVRTGRRSFYSTIMAPDCAFFRYDPGCLEALDDRGRSALKLVEARIAASEAMAHNWRQGDILIIDNWRVLHGRSPSDQASGRRLARILIDA
ncbi:TauD/TfdA family dioxygenase [Rhizobium laguerreae]